MVLCYQRHIFFQHLLRRTLVRSYRYSAASFQGCHSDPDSSGEESIPRKGAKVGKDAKRDCHSISNSSLSNGCTKINSTLLAYSITILNKVIRYVLPGTKVIRLIARKWNSSLNSLPRIAPFVFILCVVTWH